MGAAVLDPGLALGTPGFFGGPVVAGRLEASGFLVAGEAREVVVVVELPGRLDAVRAAVEAVGRDTPAVLVLVVVVVLDEANPGLEVVVVVLVVVGAGLVVLGAVVPFRKLPAVGGLVEGGAVLVVVGLAGEAVRAVVVLVAVVRGTGEALGVGLLGVGVERAEEVPLVGLVVVVLGAVLGLVAAVLLVVPVVEVVGLTRDVVVVVGFDAAGLAEVAEVGLEEGAPVVVGLVLDVNGLDAVVDVGVVLDVVVALAPGAGLVVVGLGAVVLDVIGALGAAVVLAAGPLVMGAFLGPVADGPVGVFLALEATAAPAATAATAPTAAAATATSVSGLAGSFSTGSSVGLGGSTTSWATGSASFSTTGSSTTGGTSGLASSCVSMGVSCSGSGASMVMVGVGAFSATGASSSTLTGSSTFNGSAISTAGSGISTGSLVSTSSTLAGSSISVWTRSPDAAGSSILAGSSTLTGSSI